MGERKSFAQVRAEDNARAEARAQAKKRRPIGASFVASALTGPLAFALEKDAGHSSLLFTAADGRPRVTEVEPRRTSSAMQLAAECNAVSSLLAAADAAPTEE